MKTLFDPVPGRAPGARNRSPTGANGAVRDAPAREKQWFRGGITTLGTTLITTARQFICDPVLDHSVNFKRRNSP
jgi:hypothetical protein